MPVGQGAHRSSDRRRLHLHHSNHNCVAAPSMPRLYQTAWALNNGYIRICSHNSNTSHLLNRLSPSTTIALLSARGKRLFYPILNKPKVHKHGVIGRHQRLLPLRFQRRTQIAQPPTSSTLGVLRLRFSDCCAGYSPKTFRSQVNGDSTRFNVVIQRPLFMYVQVIKTNVCPYYLGCSWLKLWLQPGCSKCGNLMAFAESYIFPNRLQPAARYFCTFLTQFKASNF
ncbi:hypothetical protein BDV93DRAFT_511386 [Ceratobasidium sp. AG-I]|nr:hypothetical protein BDV93DRAFT_511386 [Ceratobasidium sp. AG-I]